mmetsp:Transcript_137077/g.309586  ORF Transcript_137077/g.309586 Transcript_137077/m.309586 type:complete len:216 (-) Transcript_137077:221-868(-)
MELPAIRWAWMGSQSGWLRGAGAAQWPNAPEHSHLGTLTTQMIVDQELGCCASAEPRGASLETFHPVWVAFAVPWLPVAARDLQIALALGPYEDSRGDGPGEEGSASGRSWVWSVVVIAWMRGNLHQACDAAAGSAVSAASLRGATPQALDCLRPAPRGRRRQAAADGTEFEALHLVWETQQGLANTSHFLAQVSIEATSSAYPPTAHWLRYHWH